MKKRALGLGAAMYGSVAMAGGMGVIESAPVYRFVSTISLGPMWAQGGETQTIALTPTIQKTYSNQGSWGIFPYGEVFLGVQVSPSAKWFGEYGIAVGMGGHAKIGGVIWDDANPLFNNHQYQYRVTHGRVIAKAKWLYDSGTWVMPWFSAGIGVGMNRAHDFDNTPLIFPAIRNADFSSHTQATFTYSLGSGLQKKLNEHWQAGVGYEFSDWGASELGRAAGQSRNTGLTASHLYTHGAMMNLTYTA